MMSIQRPALPHGDGGRRMLGRVSCCDALSLRKWSQINLKIWWKTG